MGQRVNRDLSANKNTVKRDLIILWVFIALIALILAGFGHSAALYPTKEKGLHSRPFSSYAGIVGVSCQKISSA
jgi:hypothetical protein